MLPAIGYNLAAGGASGLIGGKPIDNALGMVNMAAWMQPDPFKFGAAKQFATSKALGCLFGRGECIRRS